MKKEREKIERTLSERLEAHDESRRAAQDRLEGICKGLEENVDELENRLSSELEEKSVAESRHIQSALADVQMDSGGDTPSAIQRAKAELLVMQFYNVVKSNVNEERCTFDASSLYELRMEREILPEVVETLRPTGVRASKTRKGIISLLFSFLGSNVLKALSRVRTRKSNQV